METAATDVPVIAVWATLLGGALVVLAGLALLAWWQSRDGPTRAECARLRAESDELTRYATVAAEKAAAARSTTLAARVRCAAAEDAREAARQAHDTAQREFEEVWRQVRAGRVGRETGGAQRERDVSRAALAAYRRGDLSVDQLREVWRRAGGGDPFHDEEAERLAAREREARRVYTWALADVRTARQAAGVSEVAAQALADEAAEAAAEAQAARELAARCR